MARREFVYRLVDDDTVRRFRSNQGDRLATEREFGRPVDDLFSVGDMADWRVGPYAFLIHTHMVRTDGLTMGFADFCRSTLPGSLHSFAVPTPAGDQWLLFDTTWTFQLVGEPEPRDPFRPVFADFAVVEKRLNMSPMTALMSAEAQAHVIHAHLLRAAQASGGSVLDHARFADGVADGALDWVEITEPVEDDETAEQSEEAEAVSPRPFEVVSF